MAKPEKLLDQIRSGRVTGNVSFNDLLRAVRSLGLAERKGAGSHLHVFQANLPNGNHIFLNLQPEKNSKQAKLYQLAQVAKAVAEIDAARSQEKSP